VKVVAQLVRCVPAEVLSVDLQLRRIALSAKTKPGKPAAAEQETGTQQERSFGHKRGRGGQARPATRASTGDGGFSNNPFSKLRR
jgi:hypothetical protein